VIDWEHSGRSILLTHYQRLFQIRRQFRAFDGQQMRRVSTSNPNILAYTRPLENEDAIVVTNMSSVTVQTTLAIPSAVLGTILQNGTSYVVSDVYTDSSQSVTAGNAEISIAVTIPAYGSYVGIIASERREVLLPTITSVHSRMSSSDIPTSMRLYQNYPNPFNPSTTIRYDLPLSGNVSLVIYNAIGQEVDRLVEGHQHAGTHEVAWRANAQTSSGLYVARLVSSQSTMTLKLMYLR